MSFPHYPAYKDSGVEWLGEVPEHWKVGNIRHFALMRTGHTPSRSNPEYWENCEIPWFTLADVWQLRDGRQKYLSKTAAKISTLGLANSAAELLPAGTVCFSRTASVGFSGVMPQPMATSQDFWNWVPKAGLASDYLLYLFRAMRPEFDRLIMGSTHKTIYQGDAASLHVCVPPAREQTAIATFLDRETAKIDTLVAEYRTLIDLLKQKRQAVISHTVTKGLDPTVPMKDSGVEWLGEVPEHWNVIRLKFLSRRSHGDGIQIGPYGSMLTGIQYDEESLCKLFGQENVISGDFGRGRRWIPETDIANFAGYGVQPGDILFTRKGSIGQCIIAPQEIAPGIIDSDTIRLRLDDDSAIAGFIVFGFRSAPYIQAQIQVTT